MKYFITIDDFYDVDFYNETIQALKNNKIPYKEYISTKMPFKWYINTDKLPVFINYELSSQNEMRFLVSKTQPLYDNEEYKLKRRETDGYNIKKFIVNDAFDVQNKYTLCFRYKHINDLRTITKNIPTKIYLIGKFKGWNLAITFNKYVKSEIIPDFIVLEKHENEMNEIGEFERYINYYGLKGKDFIQKYTQTPYIENGKYFPIRKNI